MELIWAKVPVSKESDNDDKQQERNCCRSAARKREVVLRLLRGESVDVMSRELSIEICRLEQWREKALVGIDESLKKRQNDLVQAGLDPAMRWIGELAMENELLWERGKNPGLLAKRRSSK